LQKDEKLLQLVACLQQPTLTPSCIANFRSLLSVAGLPDDIFLQFASRFDAAKYAWIIDGQHTHGHHQIDLDGVHPTFAELFAETKGPKAGTAERSAWRDDLKELLWDTVSICYLFFTE
jgi:hypothetical protein